MSIKRNLVAIIGIAALLTGTGIINKHNQIEVKTKKENIKKIQEVVEMKLPKTGPTKDEIALAQIVQRKTEIENLKKQEELKQIQQPVRVASATYTGGVENWRPLVAKYFPSNQVDNALLTMSLESGGNPRAVSKTDDHGLFQINHGLANYGEKIYDPEFNVSLAYNGFFKTRGWKPWYAVRGILW